VKNILLKRFDTLHITHINCQITNSNLYIIKIEIFASRTSPKEPNIFVPERHSIPRHPLAFIPFGAGPRICVGRRFALMEIKLYLTRLLRQFSIHPGKQMEENFKLKDTLFILQPESLYIKTEKRF
jgi:hypothetical protein